MISIPPLILALTIGSILYIIPTKQVWATPVNGLIYEPYFKSAESKYNLPTSLLSRMAQQESNYNSNAYNPSGARGLMQIIPKWHPGVNVYDPYESIQYAGSLMRQYFNEFKSWDKALGAYNWGETNVRNYGLSKAPLETRNYIREILTDIGLRYVI